jgi:quercetin dioxygenase-like cupin family protein
METTLKQPTEATNPSSRPLNVFGTTVEVLADGASTGGASTVARILCPPGGGAPLHSHQAAESFYVISGILTVVLSGQEHQAAQGTLTHAEPNAAHAFRNDAAEDAIFLSIATPAGHEHFFRAADELARAGRFTPESAEEVCRKNGILLHAPKPASE